LHAIGPTGREVSSGPLGIRSNAIAPGPVGDTEGARRLFPGEAGEQLAGAVPTRRLGTIADIALLALFVLSDAASNLNGSIIPSNGGLCLAGNYAHAFGAASAR
jgi:peroxisomal 2,4-dienoyl-CoA reductase